MAGNFTPGEKLPDFMPWNFESLDTQPKTAAVETVKLPTAEDVERIHQDAHREGYEAGQQEGYEAGYQSGKAQVEQEAERLRALADGLDGAIKNLEQELSHGLSQEVLSLSLDIAKQMLRQALLVKPELLIPVIKSAMESLPQNIQHPHIHLHPEDAVLVRDIMGSELSHAGWRIVEDLRVLRGGCMIETASAEIDASLPSRWRRIATMLGQSHAWLDDAE